MTNPTRRSLRSLTALAALAAAALTLPGAARAQDYGAMVQQSMARMNQIISQSQQNVGNIVQQRMQDPQVQAAYRQYVAQSGGRPAMDFPTYTYNYIYTRGFSREGIAHARGVESGNRAAEMQALQGVRQAEQNRADAMAGLHTSRFNNRLEAGNQLMGNSTFYAPNGTQTVLPHTWQRNTTHVHQGNTYHVDHSGQYYVRAANGWWYPLAQR